MILGDQTSSSTLVLARAGSTSLPNGEYLISQLVMHWVEFLCGTGTNVVVAEVALHCSQCCLLDAIFQIFKGQTYVFSSEMLVKSFILI